MENKISVPVVISNMFEESMQVGALTARKFWATKGGAFIAEVPESYRKKLVDATASGLIRLDPDAMRNFRAASQPLVIFALSDAMEKLGEQCAEAVFQHEEGHYQGQHLTKAIPWWNWVQKTRNELEADRYAAERVSPKAMHDAIVQLTNGYHAAIYGSSDKVSRRVGALTRALSPQLQLRLWTLRRMMK